MVQIWFRGGADYIVPRRDVAIFTLGCLPRDRDRAAELERLADEIHRVSNGRMTDLPSGFRFTMRSTLVRSHCVRAASAIAR